MGASIHIPVKPSIWDWIISIGNNEKLRPKDLQQIDVWRTGESDPTVLQISKLSKRLNVPFGYFFLAEPLDDTPAVFAHRTVANAALPHPSRDLVDTIFFMQSIQDWAHQDSLDADAEPLPYVGSCKLNSVSVKELAQLIRKELKLSKLWFRETNSSLPPRDAFDRFREACEASGIIVMLNGVVGDNTHRALNPKEFRAFALIDAYDPLIFINRADSSTGQVFSLAHEVAHIWLGKEELYNESYQSQSNSPIEVLCNATAAELLIPQAYFVQEWRRSVASGMSDIQTIKSLTHKFPVSVVTVARRALDAGYINQADYEKVAAENLKQWEREQKKNTPSGGNYYNTKQSRLDHRFLARLKASVSEGRTTYSEAYKLTGSNRITFPKILEAIGVR